MIDTRHNIKRLITKIYECQKRIILNRRMIKDLEMEGKSEAINKLTSEINMLEARILELKKELDTRHSY